MSVRLPWVRSGIIVAFAAVFALLGIAVDQAFASGSASSSASVAASSSAGGSAWTPATAPVAHNVTSVPVIVWHEMNNGCQSQDATCISHDPETVSSRQFGDELGWLYQQGYHTVTMSQYVAWTQDEHAPMPSKPVLLIADNGIGNFLLGAQPYLVRYHYQVTAAVVTGFADGAAGKCTDPEFQPGCPADDEGWDLTWPQLRLLGPEYNFILEAGASGHFVQARDTYFYTTKLPGESDSAYEHRVISEQSQGWQELISELGSRVDTSAWVVPYSDLGYPRGDLASSTPQPYNGPAGWLISYAAAKYKAVFVEDAERNGVQHERFRLDVNGQDTLGYFTTTLKSEIQAGDFRWASAT
jgi:hypothetical protein